ILLKEKAERGDTQAAFLLGQLHYEEILFDGIKAEDPRALYQLAVIYYVGLGTKEDLVRTIFQTDRVFMYCRCSRGSLESQGALGVMYLYGQGVRKDPDAALFCLKEAAERGNVYAQGHLTACYYHRKLYSRAAALGERVCRYEDISAIERHTDCLEEFIRKGIAIAMFYSARCLQLGRGVLKNRDRAARIDPEICKELQMDVVQGRI
uniref:LRP2-binding protein n=1 Tax=Sinocyclocheilus anshuiensis TaxID=1608454 RepID=A0A671Q3N3_9TELE